MAASYSGITIDANTISNIKATLIAKSLITSVYYETTRYLISSTPLTSKVIKIDVGGAYNSLSVYYGDAWTSTTTITNPVTICSQTSAGGTLYHMVADTTFFFIGNVYTTSVDNQLCAYIGALDNGDVLVFGLSNGTSSSYYGNCLCKNITDGTTLQPLTLGAEFLNSSAYLYKYDILWKNQADGKLEMNGSNPAKAVGISAVSSAVNAWIKGANFLLTPSMLSVATVGNVIRNQLLLQF